jgi:nitrite reductase/ring-hydroxylating ferredoxin subunit
MGSAALTHVGAYRRRVRAEIGRIWENVLDWEHLPWLHRTTFSDVRLIEARRDGWCASAGLQPAAGGERIGIETRLERGVRRYLTLTTDGPGMGTEIWTLLEPASEESTDIEVRFLVPGVPSGRAAAIGDAYVRLYARLWEEDEAMMMRRTELLGRGVSGAASPERPAPSASDRAEATLRLGSLESLRPRLPLPVELDGRRYRLVALGDEIVAHATTCPHFLGPLEEGAIADGCVQCPWHGYRFDVRTGQCMEHAGFRLDVARVAVDPRTLSVTVTAPPRGR